jgi:hypothetical protein
MCIPNYHSEARGATIREGYQVAWTSADVHSIVSRLSFISMGSAIQKIKERHKEQNFWSQQESEKSRKGKQIKVCQYSSWIYWHAL